MKTDLFKWMQRHTAWIFVCKFGRLAQPLVVNFDEARNGMEIITHGINTAFVQISMASMTNDQLVGRFIEFVGSVVVIRFTEILNYYIDFPLSN